MQIISQLFRLLFIYRQLSIGTWYLVLGVLGTGYWGGLDTGWGLVCTCLDWIGLESINLAFNRSEAATLTGFVVHRSVVLLRQISEIYGIADEVRAAKIGRLGRAVATAAQQSVAGALNEAAGEPAAQEELARAAPVLALRVRCDVDCRMGIGVAIGMFLCTGGVCSV